MYDCTVKIYFASCSQDFIQDIKNIPALGNFCHLFFQSAEANVRLAREADLIFCGPGLSLADSKALLEAKGPETEVLLLLERESPLPELELAKVNDIWRLPMSAKELGFRFGHWQKAFKQGKDLWQSELFLNAILETSPNLIWFKDKDGVHTLVSDSFCKTVEKSREQIHGQRHANIWNVSEEEECDCTASDRLVIESGRMQIFEEAVETGSGHRLLTVFKSPLRNLDGSIMGTMGIGMDITQERSYNEQLFESKAALETIFTTMDCGVLTHSLDGKRVLAANRAALDILDYHSIEALQAGFKMVADTVLDEDKPKLRAAVRQLKNIGDSTNYEYRVLHADGRLVHVMGNAKLVEREGEIVCQRFLLDCTAQKEAEEERQSEKERQTRELVRALSVDYQFVSVLDPKANEGIVLQILDYPDDNLGRIISQNKPWVQKVQQYIECCVHPDDREIFREHCTTEVLKEILSHQDIYYFNYRVITGSDVHYFQLKAVRVGRADEDFAIVLGLQSVDARTRQELEQRSQLGEALDQARKASHAKSIFLANMSHDIRTPMNAVIGYTSLALSKMNQPKHVEGYLKKILDSGKHLISLINDVLDMSYIESGKIQLDEKVWKLPELLSEVWSIVRPMASAKFQEMSLDLEHLGAESVYCDKLRLKQILMNLLSNSVKYTPNGGKISMEVRQQPAAMPGFASYEFRIRDNGIGMDRKFLAHIFEPFERAHESVTAGIQGTGLGMAITKNLVEMMGGEIEVKSELGQGTEFVFRVVLRLASLAGEAPSLADKQHLSLESTPPESAASEASAIAGARARLLLAEDNEMNQEIAIEFLTAAGYTVDLANNGQEAVEMLKAAGPDHYSLVLMDVQMPVLDGYGAAEKIRALDNPRLAQIPIIALTANSFEEDRQKALNAGMNRHIAKPIDFKLLFATLDEILNQAKS